MPRMDFTLLYYTASVFVALLAFSSWSHWGVAEVHTYTVPPFMEERGYSTRLVANQVVDAMRQIQIEVASIKEVRFVVQGQVQPIGEVASYFGIVELVRAAESVVGLDPRVVELEITQHAEAAHWRVRGDHVVRGYTVRQGYVTLDDPDALIERLGLEVMGYVSPFEALSYHYIRDTAANQYDTTIAVASELLVDCTRNWAWACTADNLQSAHLLRGLAHLYSDATERAFEDFAAASKIGNATALGVAFYGDAFAALGREEEAEAQYRRAAALDSGVSERFHSLAKGYAAGENHWLADRRYRTAAALGAESEEFLADWGDSLHALGQFEAALEKYRLAEAEDTETELYADRIDRALKALDERPQTPQGPEVVPAPGAVPTPGVGN